MLYNFKYMCVNKWCMLYSLSWYCHLMVHDTSQRWGYNYLCENSRYWHHFLGWTFPYSLMDTCEATWYVVRTFSGMLNGDVLNIWKNREKMFGWNHLWCAVSLSTAASGWKLHNYIYSKIYSDFNFGGLRPHPRYKGTKATHNSESVRVKAEESFRSRKPQYNVLLLGLKTWKW